MRTSELAASGALRRTRRTFIALGLMPSFIGMSDALGAKRELSRSVRRTLLVGPTHPFATPSQAANAAENGDFIEVAAGDYSQDVAVWTQDNLTIRTIGGRGRLIAGGASAEGKAIWVIRGGRVHVQGFDFIGTQVAGRNGAGIRFESGNLTVKDCRFIDNEMGLLTSNNVDAELIVEDSEFAFNKRLDGHNHNLYVGAISTFKLIGSYVHHGHIGHLVKSRAAVSHILYNRLVDSNDGRSSYELEFPNGGVAIVIGNMIQQSPLTDNPVMISYGAEGYRWADNFLGLTFNTLVDDLPLGGRFLRVTPGDVEVRALNNLTAGGGGVVLSGAGGEVFRNNFALQRSQLVGRTTDEFRLSPRSRSVFRAIDAGSARGVSLQAAREFREPRGTSRLVRPPRYCGARQRTLED